MMNGFAGTLDDGLVEFEVVDGAMLPSAEEGIKFSLEVIVPVWLWLAGPEVDGMVSAR